MVKKTQIYCISFICLVAAGSASDGSSKKFSTICSKLLKPNHIRIVIFRKHFSLSLRNIYDLMFLFWHFDVFYFFIQFSAKKSALKTIFSIFLQFLMHSLIPPDINFITNIKYTV